MRRKNLEAEEDGEERLSGTLDHWAKESSADLSGVLKLALAIGEACVFQERLCCSILAMLNYRLKEASLWSNTMMDVVCGIGALEHPQQLGSVKHIPKVPHTWKRLKAWDLGSRQFGLNPGCYQLVTLSRLFNLSETCFPYFLKMEIINANSQNCCCWTLSVIKWALS